MEILKSIYSVNQELLDPTPKTIIIFDDVLTEGTHYTAIKETLLSKYTIPPEIYGLFIALSVYEDQV